MATTSVKVLELPNIIKKIDEAAAVKIEQNFEELAYAVSYMQNYLNETGFSALEGNSQFETRAITSGLDADKPTN